MRTMTKSFPFRIRKQYFDQIMNGDKTVEYRPDSPFWQHRLLPYCNVDLHQASLKALKDDLVAVFVSGPRVHRRSIVLIARVLTPPFSKQGMKDVPTDRCFEIHLGQERTGWEGLRRERKEF